MIYQRKQHKLLLQQEREEASVVQQRLEGFYASQVELLAQRMREEEHDFAARLHNERRLRGDMARKARRSQEARFRRLRRTLAEAMEATSTAGAVDAIDVDGRRSLVMVAGSGPDEGVDRLRAGVYDLVNTVSKQEARRSKRLEVSACVLAYVCACGGTGRWRWRL